MRSLLLATLLLAGPAAAAAAEPPAPPAPEVRGPALPIPRAPAPEAEAPHAPEAAAPQAPAAPPAQAAPATTAGTPTLEDHAAQAVPALHGDAARTAGGEAAAAAAAVRSLTPKREARPEAREQTVPPSLAPRALAEELRRAAGGRASDREALASERTRLEKLSKEIAEARAALKVETERLAALVKAAAEAPPAKGPRVAARPGAKGAGPSPVETLAKTVKSMKPGQAAALLGRVDRSLAAALLERMKPSEAAAVLEQMDGPTSAALVGLIARKEAP